MKSVLFPVRHDTRDKFGLIRICPFFFCLFLFIQEGKAATTTFDFNQGCKRAYELIFKYDLAAADKVIANERGANPNNLVLPYLDSYHDLLEVFFSENRSDYASLQKKEGERESLLEKSSTRTPYRNFCLAEVYTHDALIRLKFGDNISAAYKIKTAYRLLKECRVNYPAFIPANKDLLLMEGAIGTLPKGYRTLLAILGFTGDLKKSALEYKQYMIKLNTSPEYLVFRQESMVYYSFMNYYLLNEPVIAWEKMKDATSDYEKNPLSAFFRASMAMRTRHNAEAAEALAQYASNPPIKQLEYMYGVVKLQQLDAGGGYYLSRFLRSFTGEGYIKDGYLKLGWAFLLKGDTAAYKNCLFLVERYGNTRFEEDKNALKESKRKTLPDIHLLKARLLYDGGLYDRAKEELESVPVASLKTTEDKSECFYRLGRIYEGLGNTTEAIKNYELVITKFSAKGVYFPPAACLYTAMIYEKQKNILLAKQYYQKCLLYSDYPYEDSFNQKANAGLKRIE